MKKRNMSRRTAASIIAGALMSGAAFLPGCNRPESVYGPPEWFEGDDGPEPGYDPADNGNDEVYGPPEWFDGDADDAGEGSDSYDADETADSAFLPAENMTPLVYGPPWWFEDGQPGASTRGDAS